MAQQIQIKCINKSDRLNPHERILSVGGVNPSGTPRASGGIRRCASVARSIPPLHSAPNDQQHRENAAPRDCARQLAPLPNSPAIHCPPLSASGYRAGIAVDVLPDHSLQNRNNYEYCL